MDSSWLDDAQSIWTQLQSYKGLDLDPLISSLGSDLEQIRAQLDEQGRYSKPMPWIGMYIASASFFCILAMTADLIHGLRNKKLWFPCKYFTLNAASLTLIAIAMKLPMDLSNSMPRSLDQTSKLGSMAFMCTMMANLFPSLATMDGKELVTNMIALGVLVITFIVNVCIQLKTNVISDEHIITTYYIDVIKEIAGIYVGMLFLLLIVHTCSSLAILKSKQMLESKYQQVHETALRDQHPETLRVEKLKERVSYYWIMAATGSPQFMIASSPTTIASGVLCGTSTLIYTIFMFCYFKRLRKPYYGSSYQWSIIVISIMQLIGVILGTIAPVSRCFTSLSFELSRKLIWNHCKVFRVESYWTQKLYSWKQSRVASLFHSRKWNIVMEKLKITLLDICIRFQKSVIVACKMITLIPIFIVACVWCCSHCWKWLKALFSATDDILSQKNHGQSVEQKEDLHQYALQIQDDIVLADRTLKGISKSLKRLIQMAEKEQPDNLMKLLAVSIDFKGVGMYDNHHVSRLISQQYLDCWSLPLITLTTIAIFLPEIENNIVDQLLSSVSEGLVYVRNVEEILNVSDEYVSARKAAKLLWTEVEFNHKWLGITQQKLDPQLNKPQQILKWLGDTARKMVDDVQILNIGYQYDNSIYRSIAADSMYRITETIMFSYHNNTDKISQRKLYEQVLSMIADILAACLTNLPRVIIMKCHTSEIEKREASLHVAAQLLGKTMQIINFLEDRELPSLNPDELAVIGKWCAYYNHSSP